LGPPSGAPQQVTQQLRSYAGRLKSTNQSLQGLLSEPSSTASESAAKVKQAKSMVQVMAGQLQRLRLHHQPECRSTAEAGAQEQQHLQSSLRQSLNDLGRTSSVAVRVY
jgi:hypothetical protein